MIDKYRLIFYTYGEQEKKLTSVIIEVIFKRKVVFEVKSKVAVATLCNNSRYLLACNSAQTSPTPAEFLVVSFKFPYSNAAKV